MHIAWVNEASDDGLLSPVWKTWLLVLALSSPDCCRPLIHETTDKRFLSVCLCLSNKIKLEIKKKLFKDTWHSVHHIEVAELILVIANYIAVIRTIIGE